jgi:alanine racemase
MLLRNAGIQTPIVLMEGLFTGDELQKAAHHHFTLVIHHEAQVEMLEKEQLTHPISVWLKMDTGMHRLGFPPEQFDTIYHRLQACPNVKKPMGLMSHFAVADSDPDFTRKQIQTFLQATQHLAGPKSLANSAGILAFPESHCDWVRPGLILYGASPFADKTGLDYDLQPVMSLTSELIAVHPVARGERVGYGATWTAPTDCLVGVVGMGYGDGYPQFISNGTPILVNGVICPLAGRVSMDMLTVDLSDIPNARVGDPVVLWGKGLPVEGVAKNNGTSAYELLTRITQRVHVEVQ